MKQSQRHAWMIIKSKKKKMDHLENCPQFAHKLFWNVYNWPVLVDLIFYGLWTNLLVRSQHGQKLVTNVWHVWSLTLITYVNTSNISMWETQHNIADWDCFKTLILQEALKTRSQHQGDFCACSEVAQSYKQLGCAGNRLQFHLVLQTLR